MRSGMSRTNFVRLRNAVASWIDPKAVSAAHAKDVAARRELLERNGVVSDRTAASRIAAGREGRDVVLLGRKKLARARSAEPVA
jgi:hypothetical protein